MNAWDWQDRAACRGMDVALFCGHDGERQHERETRERKAKAVCATCPVSVPCDATAVSRRLAGIWAGRSEEERATERRRATRRDLAARRRGEAA